MRDREKTEYEGYNNGEYGFADQNMPSFPCTKHPYSASSSSTNGGICAYCLTDRLYQLVCPVCGEQKLPTCSCSEASFSSSNDNAASAGRISFHLANDKNNVGEISCPRPSRTDNISILGSNDHQPYQPHYQQQQNQQEEDYVVAPPLRRSNSTCVDMNRTRDHGRSGGAFSKLGKLFRKKKDKTRFNNFGPNNRDETNDDTNKSEMAMPECVGVSRSRSISSFRGFYDTEESGRLARASNVSVNNYMLDSAKMSCFSESEARMSNFDYDPGLVGPNRNIYSVKESDFSSCGDDPAFIDLKFHEMSLDSRPDLPLPGLRRGGFGMSSTREFRGGDFMSSNYGGRYSNVSEQELRKDKKNNKVWKWFSRHQTSSSRRKDNEDHYHHGFN